MNFVFDLITSTRGEKLSNLIIWLYLLVSIMNLWLLYRKAFLLGVFLVRARYFEVALLERSVIPVSAFPRPANSGCQFRKFN